MNWVGKERERKEKKMAGKGKKRKGKRERRGSEKMVNGTVGNNGMGRERWEANGKEWEKKQIRKEMDESEKGWERKYIRIRGMGKKIN